MSKIVQIDDIWFSLIGIQSYLKYCVLDKTEISRRDKTLLNYWIKTLTQCMIFLAMTFNL